MGHVDTVELNLKPKFHPPRASVFFSLSTPCARPKLPAATTSQRAPCLHPAPAPPPHRAQARALPPARPALATAAARNRPRTSLRHPRASRRLAGPPRPPRQRPASACSRPTARHLLPPLRSPSMEGSLLPLPSPSQSMSVDGRVATAPALASAIHGRPRPETCPPREPLAHLATRPTPVSFSSSSRRSYYSPPWRAGTPPRSPTCLPVPLLLPPYRQKLCGVPLLRGGRISEGA